MLAGRQTLGATAVPAATGVLTPYGPTHQKFDVPGRVDRNDVAAGFGFWIVVARMFTPEEVGAATSLISATSLIAYISLFGLNGVIVRFIANTKNPDAQVTHSMIIVGTVALFISAAYVMLVPYLRRHCPLSGTIRYACVFLVAGAAASVAC